MLTYIILTSEFSDNMFAYYYAGDTPIEAKQRSRKIVELLKRKNIRDYGFHVIPIDSEDKTGKAIKEYDPYFKDADFLDSIDDFIERYYKESKITSLADVSEAFLQIVNVAFEHGKWKFSNGETQFFASIEDQDFLDVVEKNIYQFGSTDLLKVKLLTKQELTGKGSLKTKFVIEKVLDYIKESKQIELDFDDEYESNINKKS